MNPYRKLDELKRRLDDYRPLPLELVRNLREDTVLRWTYDSNAIEGSTLTLKETKVALEGITVSGKTIREHLEAMNHREAISFVEELAEAKQGLSEWRIRCVHQLILKTIDDDHAGAEHMPPDRVGGCQATCRLMIKPL